MPMWKNFFILSIIMLSIFAISGPIILVIAPSSVVSTVIIGSVSSLSFIGTLIQLYFLAKQLGAFQAPSVSLPQQKQTKIIPTRPNFARSFTQVQKNTTPASPSGDSLLSGSSSIFNNVMKKLTYSIIKALDYSRITKNQILMSLFGIFSFIILYNFAWLLINLSADSVIRYVFLVLAFFTPLFFGIVFGRWVGF